MILDTFINTAMLTAMVVLLWIARNLMRADDERRERIAWERSQLVHRNHRR